MGTKATVERSLARAQRGQRAGQLAAAARDQGPRRGGRQPLRTARRAAPSAGGRSRAGPRLGEQDQQGLGVLRAQPPVGQGAVGGEPGPSRRYGRGDVGPSRHRPGHRGAGGRRRCRRRRGRPARSAPGRRSAARCRGRRPAGAPASARGVVDTGRAAAGPWASATRVTRWLAPVAPGPRGRAGGPRPRPRPARRPSRRPAPRRSGAAPSARSRRRSSGAAGRGPGTSR